MLRPKGAMFEGQGPARSVYTMLYKLSLANYLNFSLKWLTISLNVLINFF